MERMTQLGTVEEQRHSVRLSLLNNVDHVGVSSRQQYEQLRAERIRMNMKKMDQLGIGNLSKKLTTQVLTSKGKERRVTALNDTPRKSLRSVARPIAKRLRIKDASYATTQLDVSPVMEADDDINLHDSTSQNDLEDLPNSITPDLDDDVSTLATETSNIPKRHRGVTRCKTLNKRVATGKFKIVFMPGERIPHQFDAEFSQAIGYIVKSQAPLLGVQQWNDIQGFEKAPLYKSLEEWFIIEDLDDIHVKKLVDKYFMDAYRRWRNHLHGYYKKFVNMGKDPRESTPRSNVPLEVWRAVCDHIEGDSFQKKSKINSSNRSKLQYCHTNGTKSFLRRFKEMEVKSKIKLWEETHKNSSGEFINANAKSLYEEMTQLVEQSLEEGKLISEDDILIEVLGKRSGYKKGMGYGVAVARSRQTISNEKEAELEEKFTRTQEELNDTKKELNDTKNELNDTKNELNDTKKELAGVKAQLQNTQESMEEIRHWMRGIQANQA